LLAVAIQLTRSTVRHFERRNRKFRGKEPVTLTCWIFLVRNALQIAYMYRLPNEFSLGCVQNLLRESETSSEKRKGRTEILEEGEGKRNLSEGEELKKREEIQERAVKKD
jgi:hypothetical protein